MCACVCVCVEKEYGFLSSETRQYNTIYLKVNDDHINNHRSRYDLKNYYINTNNTRYYNSAEIVTIIIIIIMKQ